MDIVVIGAGASGLVAGIFASNKNNHVTILERNDKSAKKILVTGNGRCNYWNEDFSNSHFHSNNNEFIKEVNTIENQKEVLTFFKSIGIIPTIKNGYYYPMSRDANSIRNALINTSFRKGIKILVDAEVTSIKKENDKFIINYNDEEITADKVILATGSNAYYKKECLGYRICQDFGHNIIKVIPSLVQLIGKGDYFKHWAGVRNNSIVRIYVDGKLEKEETGEVMLTDYGVSGICVFNLSGIAVHALNDNKKVEIGINFLPEIDNMKMFLAERYKELNYELGELLEGLLNEKLVYAILNKNHLVAYKWDNMTEEQKDLLVSELTDFRLEIIGSKGFDSCQVCAGGVDTKEVDPKTFESKICKDLYIVGELLDIDGDCGGYNLGFAWTSGMIAGKSVNND